MKKAQQGSFAALLLGFGSVFAKPPSRHLRWHAPGGQPKRSPGRDRPPGQQDDGTPDRTNGRRRRRHRAVQSCRPDGLGLYHEQHPQSCRRDRKRGTDLRLTFSFS